MSVGRRPTHSRESFVAAALHIADDQGIGALTVRALGAAVGASATAIYRHFETKDALLDAIREALFGDIAAQWTPDPDPTESLVNLGRALRATALLHPSLGEILTIRVTPTASFNQLPLVVLTLLEQIGVKEDRLALGYRQLETLSIGSAIFDFSGAPHHLRDRRERMAGLNRPEFTKHTADDDAVARLNDQAFETTLRLVIASLAQRGK